MCVALTTYRPSRRDVHGAAIGPLPSPITVLNGPNRTMVYFAANVGLEGLMELQVIYKGPNTSKKHPKTVFAHIY